MRSSKIPLRMWSQDDAAQAAEIWQDHFTDISAQQLAQRAARAGAENYSSLTALIMGDPPPGDPPPGDPPPGYSALDRRRGGAQR